MWWISGGYVVRLLRRRDVVIGWWLCGGEEVM